jgi:hypothetical protein
MRPVIRLLPASTALILGLWIANAQSLPPLTARVGVAVKSATGICLSIGNGQLSEKQAVTLVDPSKPPSVIQAEIASTGVVGCPGAREEGLSGYSLRVVKGEAPDFTPLIGVVGKGDKFKTQRGVVSVQLSGAGGWHGMRSCTSTDGVHLTIWQGKPLSGARLWHQYYYLNQDLQQTCKDRDTQ